MVHPAPRIIRAPEKNSNEVPTTEPTEGIGETIGAAINVEKRHGKYK